MKGDLAQRARALAEAVIFDDCGVNGRSGNGGLLSQRTIAVADAVLLALASAETEMHGECGPRPGAAS